MKRFALLVFMTLFITSKLVAKNSLSHEPTSKVWNQTVKELQNIEAHRVLVVAKELGLREDVRGDLRTPFWLATIYGPRSNKVIETIISQAEVMTSAPDLPGACSSSIFPPLSINAMGRVEQFKKGGSVKVYVVEEPTSPYHLAAAVLKASSLYNTLNIPNLPHFTVEVVKSDDGNLPPDSIKISCEKIDRIEDGFPIVGITATETISDPDGAIIDHSGSTKINCQGIYANFESEPSRYFQQAVDHELAHSMGMADDYENQKSLMGKIRPYKPPFNGVTEKDFVASSLRTTLSQIYDDQKHEMGSETYCVTKNGSGDDSPPPQRERGVGR